MAHLDFVFKKLNKRITLDIPEKSYNANDIKDFLKEILITVNHFIINKEE